MAKASVTIKTTQLTQANLIAMLAEDGSLSDFFNAQIIKRNMTDIVPAFDEMPDVLFDEQNKYSPDHEIVFPED